MSPLSICRCCLGTGIPLKELSIPLDRAETKEVYGDMLLESFNIELADQTCSDGGICDACICRLRDATSFKRQVLAAEAQFLERLIQIKEERLESLESEDASGGERLESSDVDDDVDDTLPLSTFTKESPKKAKRRASDDRHKRNRIKSDPGSLDNSSTSLKTGSRGIGSPTGTHKLLKNKFAKSEDTRVPNRNVNVPEKVKHKVNTTAVIRFSNAIPFKDKLRDGYVCFYCESIYADPAELRVHTTENHALEKSKYITKLRTNDKHLKVDIESLECAICSMKFNDLTALKEHLSQVHGKKIYKDIGDKVLPFKLKKEPPLYCTICSQAFETFKMLHQHMNTHFRNYVCGQCGAGFVTLRRLSFHESRHAKGNFDCEQCKKTFNSKSKLNFHINGVHKGLWKRNKCPHCPERFSDYYKRQKHLVDVHNETKIEYKCNACNKEFSTKCRLTNHTKSFHLQEKNFQCEICFQMFYARRDLHRHMPKHSDVRFECNICRKTFASKTSLKEHGKMHGDKISDSCEKIEDKINNGIVDVQYSDVEFSTVQVNGNI